MEYIEVIETERLAMRRLMLDIRGLIKCRFQERLIRAAELESLGEITSMFVGFQKGLYAA